jgi:hypothetical protein
MQGKCDWNGERGLKRARGKRRFRAGREKTEHAGEMRLELEKEG